MMTRYMKSLIADWDNIFSVPVLSQTPARA